MNRYKVLLIAFVCMLPLTMAPTGGVPSRPRFQSVGVGIVAPSTTGLTVSSVASPAFIGSGSLVKVAGTGAAGVAVRANSLTSESFWSVGSNTDFGTSTNTTLNFYTNNTQKCSLSTAGVLDCPAGVSGIGSSLTALNGTNVTTGTVPIARLPSTICSTPNSAFNCASSTKAGTFTATSGVSCSSGGSFSTNTPNGVGDCTLNWPTALPANPSCVGSSTTLGVGVAISTITTTSVRVLTFTTSTGAAVAAGGHVVCGLGS